jgi:transcriptional regulator with XRE-family HTH domain
MKVKEVSPERIARSKRLQSLIIMTGLSNRAFAEKLNIPPSTLQHWEDPTNHGLTEKGARKLVKAAQQQGINCTYEWLMHGTGASPGYRYQLEDNLSALAIGETRAAYLTREQQLAQIEAELELFLNHHPETIEFIVPDDAMEPQYFKGEIVAGVRQKGKAIEQLIGKDCIVLVAGGDIYLRRICKGNLPGRYHLTHLNSKTSVTLPFFYDVTVISAAPVIWIRRGEN